MRKRTLTTGAVVGVLAVAGSSFGLAAVAAEPERQAAASAQYLSGSAVEYLSDYEGGVNTVTSAASAEGTSVSSFTQEALGDGSSVRYLTFPSGVSIPVETSGTAGLFAEASPELTSRAASGAANAAGDPGNADFNSPLRATTLDLTELLDGSLEEFLGTTELEIGRTYAGVEVGTDGTVKREHYVDGLTLDFASPILQHLSPNYFGGVVRTDTLSYEASVQEQFREKVQAGFAAAYPEVAAARNVQANAWNYEFISEDDLFIAAEAYASANGRIDVAPGIDLQIAGTTPFLNLDLAAVASSLGYSLEEADLDKLVTDDTFVSYVTGQVSDAIDTYVAGYEAAVQEDAEAGSFTGAYRLAPFGSTIEDITVNTRGTVEEIANGTAEIFAYSSNDAAVDTAVLEQIVRTAASEVEATVDFTATRGISGAYTETLGVFFNEVLGFSVNRQAEDAAAGSYTQTAAVVTLADAAVDFQSSYQLPGVFPTAVADDEVSTFALAPGDANTLELVFAAATASVTPLAVTPPVAPEPVEPPVVTPPVIPTPGDEGGLPPQPGDVPVDESIAPPVSGAPDSVYYENCDAVQDAGVGPLEPSDPGYRADLDGDADGIACEDAVASGNDSLPRTGSDSLPLALGGGIMLLLGGVLVFLNRARRTV